MKRFLLFFAMMVVAICTVQARDTYAHDDSVLPEAAKAMISKNFKAKVSLVKIDKSFGRIEDYEVILTDGTEVSFDRSGNWEEVNTNASKSVPDALVLKPIRDYVSKSHPGTKIVKLEKERKGFKIELSNDIEIEFDKAGQFLRYDD